MPKNMFDPNTGEFWNSKGEVVQVIFHGEIVRKDECCPCEFKEILRKKRSWLGWLLY